MFFSSLSLRVRVIKTIHNTVECIHKEEKERENRDMRLRARGADSDSDLDSSQRESEYVPVIAGIAQSVMP
jgi:hypothetical protein